MFKNIDDVKKYIAKTIKKYSKDFTAKSYTIAYSNRMSRTLGKCSTRYILGKPVLIKFTFNNKYLASFENNEEAIKDTILHEIAHAIAGNHNHHNGVWVACCNKIGCKATRYKKVTF